MENLENKNPSTSLRTGQKINWLIIMPIIIAVVIVAIFFYIEYQKKPEPSGPSVIEEYKPEPISRKDNPRRAETIADIAKYGCASPATIEPTITKEADVIWVVPKDGSANIVSLGRYKIKNLTHTVLDISKIWLYFSSDKLGRDEDKIYALEKSYISKMVLVVNGYEKEIKLGGPEYMLVELADYPLGDIYPYDKETFLEFEILVELKCSIVQSGTCLNNEKKSLDFLNNADIIPLIRIYALGCQEFTKDIEVNAKFSY